MNCGGVCFVQCVGSSQKRLVVCGPKPGFEEHYGHLDILVSAHMLLVVGEWMLRIQAC
jgi:hypothetical protein